MRAMLACLFALPVIATEAENIAAYIPTNLISITDGQIYLSPHLFESGMLPAVDVGRSVSRVGGKAQRPVYRAAAGSLKLAYAQFEELESFARFGTRLDEHTRTVLAHGRRIRACLRQPEGAPVPLEEQVLVLTALMAGLFDPMPEDRMPLAEERVRSSVAALPQAVRERFRSGEAMTDEEQQLVIDICRRSLADVPQRTSGQASP